MANFIQNVQSTVKNWWIPLIIGILFIATGVFCFFQPQDTYTSLAFVFQTLFVIVGLSEIFFAFSNRKYMKNWGWTLMFGILNLLIGILMFTYPNVSKETLPFFIGFLVLFRSIWAISWSLDMKDDGILDWGNLMVLGVLGVLFSFLLIWNPQFSAMTAVFWTGIVFVIAGTMAIYFAFQLRKIKRFPKRVSKELQDQYDNLVNQIKQEMQGVQDAVKKATTPQSDKSDTASS